MANEGALRTPGSGESIAADLDEHGQKVQKVGPMLWNGSEWTRCAQVEKDNGTASGLPAVVPGLYNGATYDRQRNNSTTVELFPSEARSKTVIASLTNYNARGIQLDLEITSAGSGNLVLNILNFMGHYGGIAIGPITGVAPLSHSYTIYPGITNYPQPTEGSTNLTFPGEHNAMISGVIGRTVEIQVAYSAESSWIWSLKYQLIV